MSKVSTGLGRRVGVTVGIEHMGTVGLGACERSACGMTAITLGATFVMTASAWRRSLLPQSGSPSLVLLLYIIAPVNGPPHPRWGEDEELCRIIWED